ncbi:hypothetical protein [Streptomyces tagetis]|uniref:Integral membrane protein n=1 Tax=Streptomyces tagetis TaxID=2820809 RepID=A0A940XR03_9ACTN|nr:hypothetical protein [Streptomyces sp. RG38]MBQ0829505.1 hypothetical protein [Streptomyces sp. RG38]
MYGNSAGPPSSGRATVITLRVLFAMIGFLSCGLLASLPLFRLAFVRGRAVDWVLAWIALPVSFGCLFVLGLLREDNPATDVAVMIMLLTGAASSVYFLVGDIRVHSEPWKYAGYTPPGPANAAPYYGQTHVRGGHPGQVAGPVPGPAQGPVQGPVPGPPAGPYGPTPTPPPGRQAPPGPQQSPYGDVRQPPYVPLQPSPPVVPQAPAGPAGPVPPGPARIDQVRAELDELSDYLRRHDGNHDGDHEGGR